MIFTGEQVPETRRQLACQHCVNFRRVHVLGEEPSVLQLTAGARAGIGSMVGHGLLIAGGELFADSLNVVRARVDVAVLLDTAGLL